MNTRKMKHSRQPIVRSTLPTSGHYGGRRRGKRCQAEVRRVLSGACQRDQQFGECARSLRRARGGNQGIATCTRRCGSPQCWSNVLCWPLVRRVRFSLRLGRVWRKNSLQAAVPTMRRGSGGMWQQCSDIIYSGSALSGHASWCDGERVVKTGSVSRRGKTGSPADHDKIWCVQNINGARQLTATRHTAATWSSRTSHGGRDLRIANKWALRGRHRVLHRAQTPGCARAAPPDAVARSPFQKVVLEPCDSLCR